MVILKVFANIFQNVFSSDFSGFFVFVSSDWFGIKWIAQTKSKYLRVWLFFGHLMNTNTFIWTCQMKMLSLSYFVCSVLRDAWQHDRQVIIVALHASQFYQWICQNNREKSADINPSFDTRIAQPGIVMCFRSRVRCDSCIMWLIPIQMVYNWKSKLELMVRIVIRS